MYLDVPLSAIKCFKPKKSHKPVLLNTKDKGISNQSVVVKSIEDYMRTAIIVLRKIQILNEEKIGIFSGIFM